MASYIAIDLKSFYASVECVERGLNPLDTNLVVANIAHSEKTICLAVTPSLKAEGVPGRPRLFEVIQQVKNINYRRRLKAGGFTGKSSIASELAANPKLELDFIIAPPHMRRYMEISRQIYKIYLSYVHPDDISAYSIDEVFIDITPYLTHYKRTAEEIAENMVGDILTNFGITATVGIGTNLYLAKVAMDILAKKMQPNAHGMRLAYLDEELYRRTMWEHEPLRDFWRVGSGTVKKLATLNIFTMGDLVRFSQTNADYLFKMFGKNAELLIDHAYGYEPCTMQDIKNYRPKNRSLSCGQVLHSPYTYAETRQIVGEMARELASRLFKAELAAQKLTLSVSYDVENLTREDILYTGEITVDRYGRKSPNALTVRRLYLSTPTPAPF